MVRQITTDSFKDFLFIDFFTRTSKKDVKTTTMILPYEPREHTGNYDQDKKLSPDDDMDIDNDFSADVEDSSPEPQNDDDDLKHIILSLRIRIKIRHYYIEFIVN